MAETTEKQEATKTKNITPTITMNGREIEVHAPSAAQLAMWQRVAAGFGNLKMGEDGLDEQESEQFRKLIDRLGRIILSMIEKEEDKEFFIDATIDGTIDENDLLNALTEAGEKLDKRGMAASAKKATRVKTKKS